MQRRWTVMPTGALRDKKYNLEILFALFRAKFACNLAISNPVLRWESCKSSVWESVKKCSRLCSEVGTRDWNSRVARGLQAARWCTQVKHVEKMNSHASWSTTRRKVQSSNSICSRLKLATQSTQVLDRPQTKWPLVVRIN